MGILDLFSRARRAGTGSGPGTETDAQARAAQLVDEGNDLADAGRLPEAMQRYEAALALAPGLARAHLNLGNALLARGDTQPALDAYERALAARPGYAAAHFNIGNAQARLGHPEAAIEAYAKAVSLDPGFADAWIALGNVQDDLRRHNDAIASYERALLLQPGYAQVHANLGNVLRELGRHDEAAQSYRRALALEPGLALGHLGLGSVLQEQGDWVQAAACFRQAAARQDGGAARLLAYHCANHLCDWTRRAEDEQALPAIVTQSAEELPPFCLLGLDPPAGAGPQLQREAGRRYAELKWGSVLAAAPPSPTRPGPRERLHIGYLSADFHGHATMQLLRGVLAEHDRSKFRVTAYSYGTTRDETTSQVRQLCESFRDLGALSDPEAAAQIAADQVDILVDLKGFTWHTRLGIPARRPAPVLVSWLGYPGTLGAPGLADYIIGDPVVTPPAHSSHFSETLALMPHCYQPNDAAKAIGPTPSRAQAGLPESVFVFGCFNQGYKFSPRSFDVWCRLLAEVPGSVLWLLPGSAEMVANLRREAAARGVGPDRLVFSPTLPLADHLARVQLADLALDTFPINSHTTGSDALWAGVPLVTLIGETFASRVAASLLCAAGLPELVAHSWDEYFSLARSLATDPQRLSALRARLSEAPAQLPLFDTRRFTRNLERLYGRMWDQAQCGKREIIVLEDGSPR